MVYDPSFRSLWLNEGLGAKVVQSLVAWWKLPKEGGGSHRRIDCVT